jgi:hypothetical protein
LSQKNTLYGKAFFRYWKPSKAGFLDHGEYDIPEPKDAGRSKAGEEDE